jgi:hypothetical protein
MPALKASQLALPESPEVARSVCFQFTSPIRAEVERVVTAIGKERFGTPDNIVEITVDPKQQSALARIGLTKYYRFLSPVLSPESTAILTITNSSKQEILANLRADFNQRINDGHDGSIDHFAGHNCHFNLVGPSKRVEETPAAAPPPPNKPQKKRLRIESPPPPPKEKKYQVTLTFRALSREAVEQAITDFGRDKFATPEAIKEIKPNAESEIPQIFRRDTTVFYKFTSALKDPISSAQSAEEIRNEQRGEITKLCKSIVGLHSAVTVAEATPAVEASKLPPPPPKEKKKKDAAASKQPVRPQKSMVKTLTPKQIHEQTAQLLKNDLNPLFSKKELPSGAVVRAYLEKQPADQSNLNPPDATLVLILRGGDLAAHDGLKERIINNFFGKQEGDAQPVQQPKPAKKAAAKRTKSPEPAKQPILESRLILDPKFGGQLLKQLRNHYLIHDQNQAGQGFIGSDKTSEKEIIRDFLGALELPGKTKKTASVLLRQIAALEEADQRLLIAVAQQGYTADTKLALLERGVAHLDLLRDPRIPREVFMETDDAAFEAKALQYQLSEEPAEPGTPATTVSAIEPQPTKRPAKAR